MQKVSHSRAQMKKKRNMSVRTFLPRALQLVLVFGIGIITFGTAD